MTWKLVSTWPAGVQHDAGPRADEALVVDCGVDTHHRRLNLRRRCDGIAGCGGQRAPRGRPSRRPQPARSTGVGAGETGPYVLILAVTSAAVDVGAALSLDSDAATGPLTPAQRGPFAGRAPILQLPVGVFVGVNCGGNLRLRSRPGRRDRAPPPVSSSTSDSSAASKSSISSESSVVEFRRRRRSSGSAGSLAAAPGFALLDLQRFGRRRRQFGDERQVEGEDAEQRDGGGRAVDPEQPLPGGVQESQISLTAAPTISTPASTCSPIDEVRRVSASCGVPNSGRGCAAA